MNYIKNPTTNKLLPSTLEDRMRIKINGEDNLVLFNAERYAREWISAGHMRSDDPSKRRMKNSGYFSII